MNFVVVGGAGFLGSHLVDRLLADGETVDVVDDLSRGSLANLSDARSVGGALKIHHLGAGSPEMVSLLGLRRPDVVYHLAAVPRVDPTAGELAEAFASTVHLLDGIRAQRIAKVVVALPATALYGRPANRDLPVKEQALEPRGVRGVIARATIDLLTTHREHDAVEFTALALSSVYGPRQHRDAGVVAAFVEAARTGTAPVIHGDGRQTRDFLFVDDAVDALVKAGERGSGLVVNVGTGEQTPIRDLWTAVSGVSSGAHVAPVNGHPDDLPRFAVSPVRARIHLAWSPWTSLGEGIAQL